MSTGTGCELRLGVLLRDHHGWFCREAHVLARLPSFLHGLGGVAVDEALVPISLPPLLLEGDLRRGPLLVEVDDGRLGVVSDVGDPAEGTGPSTIGGITDQGLADELLFLEVEESLLRGFFH